MKNKIKKKLKQIKTIKRNIIIVEFLLHYFFIKTILFLLLAMPNKKSND
jgi:hypothetical protein